MLLPPAPETQRNLNGAQVVFRLWKEGRKKTIVFIRNGIVTFIIDVVVLSSLLVIAVIIIIIIIILKTLLLNYPLQN
jgi:hypothetical protein